MAHHRVFLLPDGYLVEPVGEATQVLQEVLEIFV